jgi:exodeoxyribonuclease V alpha subunit
MTPILARLDGFRERGVLSALDVAFARFVAHAGGEVPELVLAAALVSRHVERGHACVDLSALAGRVVLPGDDDGPDPGAPVVAPSLARWRAVLEASPAVGPDRPLILDGAGRLYLARYWQHEQALARSLRARASWNPPVDEARLRNDLARLFPRGGVVPDWQKIAAAVAVLRGLCVVSGGPGTGKTSTVVRVLALLAGQSETALRIGLAAPTGKAAARLQEAIRAARAALPIDERLRARIPDDAATIHRLLGARRDSSRPRRDAAHPLALDVLVVDEASMVDLALMSRLVAALPPAARLVLLGDRDQLASVEAGAVLGDVCGPAPGFSAAFRARVERLVGASLPVTASVPSPLADSIVLLTRSHRFRAESGIGRLAAAVNRGAGAEALAVLDDPAIADVGRAEGDAETLFGAARAGYAAYHARILAGATPVEAFAAFRGFRVLCAHRRGPGGAEMLNARLSEVLGARGDWYPGRPVLVTENDYALRLFNGDVGIALPDPEAAGRLRVYFEGDAGRLRRIPPSRLPPHETTYAMTIHKSQGSEFGRVLLVLPPQDSRLLTRELLYTGITRAGEAVTLWGDELVLGAAIARGLRRSSGLRDALWDGR